MILLISIGLLTFLIHLYYKHRYTYWSKRGIKGPKAFPILGTYLAEHALPADETERKFYKEFGPVFGSYFNTQAIFNTADPEHIRTILSDLKTFPAITAIRVNDDYLSNSIVFRSDSRWRIGRTAQTHYYTSKNLRNLMGNLEKTTANFIENVDSIRRKTGSDDVDVKMMTKYFSIDGSSKVLFSMDVDSFKQRDNPFVKSVSTLGELNVLSLALSTFLPTSVAEFLKLSPFNLKPVESLGKHFKKMIADRKSSGVKYNDLLETLVNAMDDEKAKLSLEEVAGNCLASLFAGVETVSSALSRMFQYLAEYPDIQQKLYEQVMKKFNDEVTYEELMHHEYLDAVTSEVLRLGASFLLVSRTAAVDTKLGDYPIDKGTEIRIMTYASHTASDIWNDAMTFNPDRFMKRSEAYQNNLFAPFSYGHKQCLGMRLALLEIKFLTVNLLKKYEFCRPKNPVLKLDSFRGIMNIQSLNIAFKERIN